eukprot:9598563-Prorocentrum_lima.AAC.1
MLLESLQSIGSTLHQAMIKKRMRIVSICLWRSPANGQPSGEKCETYVEVKHPPQRDFPGSEEHLTQ